MKVFFLTGTGNKSFVAGADISEFANFSVNQAEELSRNGHNILFNFIENLSKPVIELINGFALGGGLELAMACHFRVASTNAKLGLPETSLGLIPGYRGTQRLPNLIGKGKAMELIITGTIISAEEDKNCGLVNYVVNQEELTSFTIKLAKKIMINSSIAISKAIKAINSNFIDGIDGYSTEIKEFGSCFSKEDFKEGTKALLMKRKANFIGK